MSRNYTPRRCGERWLDADCPKGVLAIMDHPNEVDRYTVFYAEPIVDSSTMSTWIGYIAVDQNGAYYHGEMPSYEAADYRYRNAHRYTRWSELPEVVKTVVRRDLTEGD